MSYLYLDFTQNLDAGSRNWDDFYKESLLEQFEKIHRRLGKYGKNIETVQKLIQYCFPITSNRYYISMPSFDRQIKKNYRRRDCYFNIIIRPERTVGLNQCLPPNMDIILIGDLTFDNIIAVTIKGIELIDTNVPKYGEISIECNAACAFSRMPLPNNETIQVPDYGVRYLHDAVLTRDFIVDLCESVYPIPNPEKAIGIYDKWKEYIDFRNYYLGKQSERYETFDQYEIKNSFIISKEQYRRDEENLQKFLLDGIDRFGKSEQVIIDREIEGADSFPLMRIIIKRNRKELLNDTVGKRPPKYEVELRRYTRNAMGLSSQEPIYDERGNLVTKGSTYYLGERYFFTHEDIEPDYSELEKQSEEKRKNEFDLVDTKYLSIIANELEAFISKKTNELVAQYDESIVVLKNNLEGKLDEEVSKNKDSSVRKIHAKEVNAKVEPLKKQLEAIKKLYKEKINKELNRKERDKEKIELLNMEQNAKISEIKNKIQEVKESVILRDFYIARNNKLIEEKKKSNHVALNNEIKQLRIEKKRQLEIQYASDITKEKEKIEKEIEEQLEAIINIKRQNETVRHYYIYFKIEENSREMEALADELKKLEPSYLIYDNKAEKAKIDRQKKSLTSFFEGFVKNPFLAAYLFSPDKLGEEKLPVQEELEWNLESLNDSQKEAVRRAVASESLFLLQGPPGTGKTQVIAEVTAQYVKRGKKVLISSETHKAIDNVFDRLPKIPEIRPLRLIPSQNRETDYSPERLVDNLYINITNSLERQVNKYEHFSETKASFGEKMKELRFKYDRLLRMELRSKQMEEEKQSFRSKQNELTGRLEELRVNMRIITDEIEEYSRTIRNAEGLQLMSESGKQVYLQRLKDSVGSMLKSYSCFEDMNIEKAQPLMLVDVEAIREEIESLNGNSDIIELEKEKAKIKSEQMKIVDPDTEEVLEGHEDEWNRLRGEFIAIGKKIKEAKNRGTVDLTELIIAKFMAPSKLGNVELQSKICNQIIEFRMKVQALVFDLKEEINVEIEKLNKKKTELEVQINEIRIKINEYADKVEELNENEEFAAYNNLQTILRQEITKFFKDFSIVREYDPHDIREAINIINEEWNSLEKDYETRKKENSIKIPMYKDICKYLKDDAILEEDRISFTKKLFDNANVFGITCTGRDRYKKSSLEALQKYNLDDIDIKSVGIDVVIIDEVSKSSFLDLLIPILYGKTVILVGDHRQLPPMYDLRHMRRDDFEGLDENIISAGINKEYTKMYEECFFKTLFESVSDRFRIMLNKQYRCHSDIMDVFNHFYGDNGNGLNVGFKNQNDQKQHLLTIHSKGRTIIEPNKHVYFIDCADYESKRDIESTSIINNKEADVVVELLKKVDDAYGDLIKNRRINYDKSKNIDERMSVGVICTYGDQAGIIKSRLKGKHFKNIATKREERLIISTVDDFQGDERDIIIVSMVRNPDPRQRNVNTDFIDKFERINVAFSRARRMLIVVGAKEFLSKSAIDLPDMNGNHMLDKKSFPVYRKIINTIDVRGRLLTASDVLGG